jgi:hypothetical protein
LLPLALALATGACSGPAAPRVTFFHPEWAFTFRYPPRWKAERARQDGVAYLFFQSPPTATSVTGAVGVTVIGQPLGAEQTLDDFAAFYLEGQDVSPRPAERPGADRALEASWADAASRSRLLILEEQGHVFGLHVTGESKRFAELEAEVDEMLASFALERPALYRPDGDERFGYALRVPPSWERSRRFTSGDQLFVQYRSPALSVDPQQQTVHAALTLSVEPAPGLDAYYEAARLRLGDAQPVISHAEWRGGYADVMRAESAMTVSRVRRFYLAGGGRGYSLSCEAREDVQQRVFRWCDLIASTLVVGAPEGGS